MKAPAAKSTTDGVAAARWPSVERPHVWALLLWLSTLLLFWRPLADLANLSLHDENSSYIPLIPPISAFLIWLHRKRIFRDPRYCPALGAPLLATAVILWFSLRAPISWLNNTDRLSVLAAVIVLAWIAIFVFCYGATSFKTALFPLLYLVLMIPLPVVASERLISFLQRGSADVCYLLFRVLGVPVLRHGFQFSLPGVDIEVAQQCSGIHSGLSLFIAGLLAGQFVLEGTWRKVCVALCIFPIAIFKNAVRIVTIAWLGIHINPAFFQGQLHRQGGLPFSVLAMAILGLLLWVLRRPIAPSRRSDGLGR